MESDTTTTHNLPNEMNKQPNFLDPISTPLLLLLSNPLWSGVVVLNMALTGGQIDLFANNFN